MKFCAECGTTLVPTVKFCSECGSKVENVSDNHSIETGKLNSEEYIQKILGESTVKGVAISPFENEKKLVAAANAIAKEVEPTTIIGMIDTSMLSNGKTGAVFTGTNVYMKESFGEKYQIPFEGINSVSFNLDKTISEKGKVQEVKVLSVQYNDESEIEVTSEDLDDNFPFELIASILEGIPAQVNKIESKNQIIQLENLGPEIITLYFRVIIAYLKQNDEVLSTKEYKELITLMTKVKVSKQVSEAIRTYRFSEQVEDLDALISEFKGLLEKENLSQAILFQALAMDIISMDKDNLSQWQTSDSIKSMLKKLHVSEKLIEYKLKEMEYFERIYTEKLDDKMINNMVVELGALATGAGISLSALAITGAVAGWGASLSGGLFALSFGTGGTFLGAAAVAAGAYGAYRGIKYFAGTSELEKFSIKQNALAEKITSLKAANTFIINDFNYLMSSINDLTLKIVEQQQVSTSIISKSGELLKQKEHYIDELTKRLSDFVEKGQSVAESGQIIERDQERMEREQCLTTLPQIIDMDKFNELIKSDLHKESYSSLIESTYFVDEEGNFILDENLELEHLRAAETVLVNIRYFETGVSSLAQGKVLAKKGFKSFSSLFSEGNSNE